ncbi:MAG: ferredoxin [Leptolyngbyaceae cyanobacterium]
MATLQRRRSDNLAGDLYVDSSCIDCDTCRWMAPETFSRIGDQSAVHHQPAPFPRTAVGAPGFVSLPYGVDWDGNAASRY